jgi:hypothetical protein
MIIFLLLPFQWEHIDHMARRFKRYLRPIFLQIDFIAHLEELKQRLEDRIIKVYQSISSGENEHLQIKKRGLH